MDQELRDSVKRMGVRSLAMLEEWLEGKRPGDERIRVAAVLVGHAIKVEHMNQVRDYTNKSLALRLIKFLPQDEETKRRYVEMTNPEIKGLLAGRKKS